MTLHTLTVAQILRWRPSPLRGRPGHPHSAETRAKMSAADGELLEAEG